MFVCSIPGADSVTVAWHAGLHYGLAAVVLIAGVVFLGLGLRAYRMSGPTRGVAYEP